MLLEASFCHWAATTNNQPGVYLLHVVPMPTNWKWKFAHFDVLNPKTQEFGLNKTIC